MDKLILALTNGLIPMVASTSKVEMKIDGIKICRHSNGEIEITKIGKDERNGITSEFIDSVFSQVKATEEDKDQFFDLFKSVRRAMKKSNTKTIKGGIGEVMGEMTYLILSEGVMDMDEIKGIIKSDKNKYAIIIKKSLEVALKRFKKNRKKNEDDDDDKGSGFMTFKPKKEKSVKSNRGSNSKTEDSNKFTFELKEVFVS